MEEEIENEKELVEVLRHERIKGLIGFTAEPKGAKDKDY